MAKTNKARILFSRLAAQQIISPQTNTPAEIVGHLVAVQAQEFAMSKWAIGLRSKSLMETDIDAAFNAGSIIRTHVVRPTWHFVSPADLRWLIRLTAPRVHQANAFMYRQCELTPALFKRSDAIIAKALEGGNHLTREELQTALARKKINAESFRLGYLMMHAELEGLICSGPRKGNQFTYALIDEWVPKQNDISNAESLALLTYRFFNSRGPATADDFKYWTGLTVKDIKKGIELSGSLLEKETIENSVYFFTNQLKTVSANAPTFLMPDYDEFGMSYKNKKEIIHADFNGKNKYNRMLVVDGLVSGTWKRTLTGMKVEIEIHKNRPLTKKQNTAAIQAAEQFGAFINRSPEIKMLG